MVLNPALFDALTDYFGSVRVADENTPLKWEWKDDPKTKRRVPNIVAAGEQYYVCCPCCGDRRFRLAFGHRFLTPLDKTLAPDLLKHNYHCYNETCNLFKDGVEHRCVTAIKNYLNRHKGLVGLEVYRVKTRVAAPELGVTRGPMELPPGFVPLDRLPPGHPALAFIVKKYGFDPLYLAKAYGVGFVGPQPGFMQVQNRIVFPVYDNGALAYWQGRTIMPDEPTRWYITPGGPQGRLQHRSGPPG